MKSINNKFINNLYKKYNNTFKKKEKLKKNNNIKNNIKIMNYGGTKEDYKEEYIEILKQLKFYNKKYEKDIFKTNSYAKAIEALENLNEPLINSSQIKNIPNIGKAMTNKLDELIKTNKVQNLESLKEKYPEGLKEYEKEKIKEIFMQIHGIGDKRAQEIVDLNILTIEELKKQKDEKIRGKKKNLPLLDEKQQKGLIYFEETKERIPRSEIEEYEKLFKKEFLEVLNSKDESLENHIFEITGSYRRGKSNSGDIDFLFTAFNNNKLIYYDFINHLISKNIIVVELTRGNNKSLLITKLTPNSKARRVDFLYASPEERPFALLYFTGSKEFNTAMRQIALNQQLTLNEHGFHKINKTKEKTEKITKIFKSEKDIFDYLNMEYKEPYERIDGNSVVLKSFKKEELPKPETPKPETPKPETPKPETPKPETPKPETPKPETLKPETPKPETPKPETPKPENYMYYGDDEKWEVILEGFKKKELEKTPKPETPKPETPKPEPKNKTLKAKSVDINAKQNIEDFKSKTKLLEVFSEDELTNMLKLLNKTYYDSDLEPLLTDNQYDILRDYVLEKYPNNKIAQDQHAAITLTKDKVKLPYELWSMDKIKPTTNELNKFKEKYNEPFVISAKLDGISALYTTNEDKPHLYTRGNGKYGQNIDHLIQFLKLPKTKELAIRGELIIKEEVFKAKYSEKYKNSRNFVSGLVNKKKLTKMEEIIINDLDFVAYEVIVPTNLKPSQQFEFLETLKPNINIVKYESNINQSQLTNEFLSDKLTDYKANYMYTIDGIINIEDKVYPRLSKNPEHAFAFKMIITDQVVEARVLDVHYEASKDGYLKPRIEIEPIEVDGVTIQFATCFNAKYVLDNKIGLGTTIKLNRSGGVIPNILEVLTPADEPILPKIPKSKYSFNETNTDFVLKDLESDPNVLLKNIVGFFKELEVDGLGEGNVKKLIKAKHNTIVKILKLSVDDLLKIENFKEKMATKIYDSIQKKVKETSLTKIAAASNIFGRGFGEKRLKLITNSNPNILTTKATTNKEKEELINQVKSVEGLAIKTATQFVEGLTPFQKFLKDANINKNTSLSPQPKNKSPKSEIKEGPLANKIIVLSDFKTATLTKKEFTKQLTDLGAIVEDNLTKNTNILINGDPLKESTKVKKAKTQPQTTILTFEEFNNLYL